MAPRGRKVVASAVVAVFLLFVLAVFVMFGLPPVARRLEQARLAAPLRSMQGRVASAVAVGSTRQEAEARLAAADIRYERTWRDDTPIDYVLIGHIPSGTWVCSDGEAGVQVVFTPSGYSFPRAFHADDKVTSISQFEWPEACL